MPTQQQTPPTQDTTAIQDLCLMPALTLMVFMRRRIGLRLLKPSRLIGAGIFLYLYSEFGVAFMKGTYEERQAVQYFALAFGLFALGQYARSWREFNRGIRLHTYSGGISHIAIHNRLPGYFQRHRRIYRIVEPFFCMVVGCYVTVVSYPLGIWIIVSSFSLRIFEQARYDAAITRDFDIVDGLSEAEIQQQSVEYFSGGKPQDRAAMQRANDQRAGLESGVAPDIERKILEHKKSKNLPSRKLQ